MAEEAAANVNVTSALPDDLRESVAVGNLKTLGDASSFYTAQQMNNATTFQAAMHELLIATTSKAVENLLNTNPREGGADIAALQQLAKAAQTTPPQTGAGG